MSRNPSAWKFLPLILAVGLALFLAKETDAVTCPGTLSYGDTIDCSISSPGEIDSYTFSGASGERVFVRMTRTSGGINPQLAIKRPDGTQICAANTGSAYHAEITSCLLDVTGTLTVRAWAIGSGTGNYRLYFQRSNGPVNAISSSYGSTHLASPSAGDVGWYTFSGTAGERVFARMADSAGTGALWPAIRIFGPSGTVLCSGTGNTYFSEIIVCTLDSTGTYSLVADDVYNGSGTYGLHVQRTGNPVSAISVGYNDTVTGSLTLAQATAYTFSGSAGERALARMIDADASASPYPYIRIFRPDGSLLCTADSSASNTWHSHIQACLLDSTGTHTLMAYDYYGRPQSYGLHLQRANQPVGASSIALGEKRSGVINLAEMDAWIFSGQPGYAIKVKMETTSGILYPEIRVHRPDGSVVCPRAGGSLGIDGCPLDTSGIHMILASDYYGDRTGNYDLSLSVAPPVFNPEDLPQDDGPYGGDPVNVVTGDFFHSHTDIAIPGNGVPLSFTRYYHSGSSINRYLGYGWTHNYDWYLEFPSGAVKVFYPDGHAVAFVQSGGSYVPRAGVYDTLVQNGDGTYTLTTRDQIRYSFSSAGRLTSIKDGNNTTTSLLYTGTLLTSITDPGGRSLTVQYDGSNRVWKVVDPLPSPGTRTVEFTYDANSDLTQVKDVKGGTTTYAYSSHRMTSLTDSNSHVQVQNFYDSRGRVAEQRDATSGTTCFHYEVADTYSSAACLNASPAPGLQETIIADPRGNKTTYKTDSSFRVAQVKDALTGTASFAYDVSHNVICVTDQRGNKTAYAYDSAGNLTEMIDALNTDASCQLKVGGVKWTFTYTSLNDIDLVTDPLGRLTDNIYDSTGNLTRIVRKDSGGAIKQLTCIEVNSSGLPTAFVQSTDLTVPGGATDPCTGNRTKLEYDQYGNRTAIVDARFSGQPTPPKTNFTYDLGGRMLTVTNELSHTTTNTYDAQNKGLTTTNNLSNTTAWTHDAKGNLKTIVDANRKVVGVAESGAACGTAGTGNGTDDDGDTVVDDGCPSYIYNYDNADRLVQVIDAVGNSTTYGYDAAGNRISVTNAKRQPVGQAESGSQCGTAGTGNGTDDDSDTVVDDGCPSSKLAYDALNRLQSSTDALGRVTSYQYDAASSLTQRTDARNLVTKYFPDALNRLDLVEHWNGQTLVDSVDYTYNAVGFRTQMVDSTGTTTFTPDALDRLASVTFPGPKTVSYTYDDLPGGSVADYPGQRTVVTYPDSKTVTYTYLANGAMSTVTDWLSRQTTYTYNNARMLTKTQLPNGVWTDFGYDNADRLTSVVNNKTGPVTLSSFTYTLDATENRTQMVDLSGTHSYVYDALDRLTQVTYPGPQTDTYSYDALSNRLTKNATSYTYDAADEMLTAGGVTYGYDSNGNQTGRGTDTFTYDHENRLTQAIIASVTSTNTYNGDGLRMSHTVGGQTTNYTWDINGGLPVVLQDGTNTYVYGLDLISATDGAGAQTYFTYDGLGSTTDLTNGSATVTGTYSYDVFGAVRSQTGSSSNYWLFTGEQRDADSGLYFLRTRYYNPDIGRFLATDSYPGATMFPTSQNSYAYVKGSPVNWTDPSGRCPQGDVDCFYDYARAVVDFFYNEFLPWWTWVRDCNARLLAAGLLAGWVGFSMIGVGFRVYEFVSLWLEGYELVHVISSVSLGIPLVGGGLLLVVGTEAALAACGEAGLFPEIPRAEAAEGPQDGHAKE